MESLGKATPPPRAEWHINKQEQAADHEVATANAKFAKASPARKRVLIAKDVLGWLKVGKLVAEPGTYLLEKGPRHLSTRVNGGKCQACALGAVFACTAERIGGIRGFWFGNSNTMRYKLGPYFDLDQLYLIECAFEMSASFHPLHYELDTQGYPTAKNKQAHRAQRYCADNGIKPHNSDGKHTGRERMVLIMKNIIANKGTFVV